MCRDATAAMATAKSAGLPISAAAAYAAAPARYVAEEPPGGTVQRSSRPRRPDYMEVLAPRSRPRSAATRVASARECTPSFMKMFATWRAAVFSLITSSCARARLLAPAATSRRTSSSRALRPSRAGPRPRLGRVRRAGGGGPRSVGATTRGAALRTRRAQPSQAPRRPPDPFGGSAPPRRRGAFARLPGASRPARWRWPPPPGRRLRAEGQSRCRRAPPHTELEGARGAGGGPCEALRPAPRPPGPRRSRPR